jgi:hypothetical protein
MPDDKKKSKPKPILKPADEEGSMEKTIGEFEDYINFGIKPEKKSKGGLFALNFIINPIKLY